MPRSLVGVTDVSEEHAVSVFRVEELRYEELVFSPEDGRTLFLSNIDKLTVYKSNRLQGITSQKTVNFVVIAPRTSNLTGYKYSYNVSVLHADSYPLQPLWMLDRVVKVRRLKRCNPYLSTLPMPLAVKDIMSKIRIIIMF
jgi:hypothetical protein